VIDPSTVITKGRLCETTRRVVSGLPAQLAVPQRNVDRVRV
jgi:hypothetical protein